MIASLFRKSTPFNYAVLIGAVAVFYVIYQISVPGEGPTVASILEKLLLFGVVFGSLFVLNFIVKKNGLSRDNSYTILFYFLFLLFFPSVFDNFNLVISNFFILLSIRRLVSLHSLKTPKEKIFDASVWVFVATLFHFWSILFIVLVFISILFHVSRDFRNWLLPFIAFVAVTTTFFLFALLLDDAWIDFVLQNIPIDLTIDYFTDTKQNIALSLFSPVVAYFVVVTFLTLSNRPLIIQATYKKIISAFFIAVAIFIISPHKSNDTLIYAFAPLAIMASTILETSQSQLNRELIAGITAALAIVCFFLQL
ncbi:MAG: hypothetical protein EOO50_03470 [Flavobacterium sp.]|uniref:hypothetical protein n=1 Tax=Flavobacterium sp. TaxID=239 RepID=UPI0012005375|nr:hypothetical protein [Flavobacterium sp.]RZJ67893.1 MAG: hypothetical protein EOO50_03470 [Flavobacterium sp.]